LALRANMIETLPQSSLCNDKIEAQWGCQRPSEVVLKTSAGSTT
jgi:hypothetical protein